MAVNVKPQDVLDFWFERTQKDHFGSSTTFDDEIRAKFGDVLIEHLAHGTPSSWLVDAASVRASILVLDQFTRNLHKGTPAAFDGDARGFALALLAHQKGYLKGLSTYETLFALLPLMHNETREGQVLSLAVFQAYPDLYASFNGFIVSHAAVVERWGRMPHRNKKLGRTSTPEELEYLAGSTLNVWEK
jgi:uncharacterized protein (DUF924 family)